MLFSPGSGRVFVVPPRATIRSSVSKTVRQAVGNMPHDAFLDSLRIRNVGPAQTHSMREITVGRAAPSCQVYTLRMVIATSATSAAPAGLIETDCLSPSRRI